MPAPAELLQLIQRFEEQKAQYLNQAYNETQVRREFIDPLLEALGWDVSNKAGYAEQYKDVVHEDSIKVGGATKAPDYSCRIGGQRKFFVEAKKPAVRLHDNSEPAYQLRRYGWSAKLPISLLTNFAELAVYDCRIKPEQSDKASQARIMYLTYDQLVEKWDELVARFSPEAIRKGAFDRYAQDNKKKRGTAEVDSAFLEEISQWREQLAENIALRNKESKLKSRQLSYAVQSTIDRLIFLRIAEDRGIEPYGRLLELTQHKEIYPTLTRMFQAADAKYNSGLFHFKEEKGRSNDSLDNFTLALKIDDKVLKEIIKRLYYPDSPYQFNMIPADILGQVYEQFLGKVIRLTPKGQAKIEDKPEVKKAGGVFYTPTYIVRYIVEQTVGKLLDGKTPREKGTAGQLTICDPSCGSGSFLIGAYQYLLDWYLAQYTAAPEAIAKWRKMKNPPLMETGQGGYRLTLNERKRILLSHIYGVDIDQQAVEVTKLSLLLKVLEGETEQSLAAQMSLLQERVLPDLDRNIKCGNSLIASDFYESYSQLGLGIVDEEEAYRINVFDWHTAFPQVFAAGGFSAVIGNPPYIRIQALKEWAPKEVEFYKERYIAASKGNYDIYVVFVEKGLSLLNETGLLGYILPHKFINANYGIGLKKIISQGHHLQQLIHFGHQQVFDNATTYTCLLFLSKKQNLTFTYSKIENLQHWDIFNNSNSTIIPIQNISDTEWNFTIGMESALLERLQLMPFTLETVTDRIFQGLKTGSDKIFIVEKLEIDNNKIRVFSKHNQEKYWLEADLLHPLIKGGDSKRYSLNHNNLLILFPYITYPTGKTKLLSEDILKKHYPFTYSYLISHKKYLEERENEKMKGDNWYRYTRNQALDVISRTKIFTPDIALLASFSFDKTGQTFFTGGVAGGYGILVKPQYSEEYILGLLNSKLLDWFNRKKTTVMAGGYFNYESRYIKNFPIYIVNENSSDLDKEIHTQIIGLVKRMLQLHQQAAEAKTPQEKTILERQITAADRQIDQLVYTLYGLTAEEIALVEEA